MKFHPPKPQYEENERHCLRKIIFSQTEGYANLIDGSNPTFSVQQIFLQLSLLQPIYGTSTLMELLLHTFIVHVDIKGHERIITLKHERWNIMDKHHQLNIKHF